jgi:HPr kinase/phosphorylase
MNNTVTIQGLYDKFQQPLGLKWLSGLTGANHVIEPPSISGSGASLVGHLNLIHTNLIQVIGPSELEYLHSVLADNNLEPVTQLMSGDIALIIVTDNQEPPAILKQLADEKQVPLFHSSMKSQELIVNLRYMLGNLLAKRITLHGVFLEVLGSGVLLIGDSGIGKSELALELITRGNRLIADDAPEFSHIAPDIINGTCPELLQDLLEVRGLGVLNIRSMFGDSAIKPNKYLRLIIRLIRFEQLTDQGFDEEDRLHGYKKSYNLLDGNVPEITLPVAPGRNLAVLVESAVRNHMLITKGYNAAHDFIERQQRLIMRDKP